MKKNNNNLWRYTWILALYAGIAGLVLSFVFQITEPLKIQNFRKTEIASRREVLPAAGIYETIKGKELVYLIGYTERKKPAGYIVKVPCKGYSSTITVLAGINPDLSIENIKVLSQQETPGLGTKVAGQSFVRQFVRKKRSALAVQKDGGEIMAITGATISSRAVADGVRKTLEALSREVENKG